MEETPIKKEKKRGSSLALLMKELKRLYSIAKKEDLLEVEFASPERRIIIRRGSRSAARKRFAVPEDIQAAEPKAEETGVFIKAPMAGVFYIAPHPDAPPFIDEGDTVEKGGVICLLEAMKTFNEIRADFSCRILRVIASPGTAVNRDDPLFSVEMVS